MLAIGLGGVILCREEVATMVQPTATPGTMRSYITARAGPAASSMHGCLLAARHAAPGVPDSRSLAFATLICWLIAEALGAYMLSRCIASHGARRPRAQPGGVPRSVIFGHAGIAFTGFAAWVGFLATGWPAVAWLAICLLVPAIGLGISIVTVWTPYPARRAAAGVQPPAAPHGDVPAGIGTAETLARALSDEALTSRLVDDLLADLLAVPPAAQRPKWHLAPIIPAVHGVAALVTFLLAILAAIAAT